MVRGRGRIMDGTIEAENDVMALDARSNFPRSRAEIAKAVLGRATAAS